MFINMAFLAAVGILLLVAIIFLLYSSIFFEHFNSLICYKMTTRYNVE
jgi:hypothetical protein